MNVCHLVRHFLDQVFTKKLKNQPKFTIIMALTNRYCLLNKQTLLFCPRYNKNHFIFLFYYKYPTTLNRVLFEGAKTHQPQKSPPLSIANRRQQQQ